MFCNSSRLIAAYHIKAILRDVVWIRIDDFATITCGFILKFDNYVFYDVMAKLTSNLCELQVARVCKFIQHKHVG